MQRLNTKFESAEITLKPLGPTVSFGWVLAAARRRFLIQFALTCKHPHFLVKFLNLRIGNVGGSLLLGRPLAFEDLNLLAQFVELLFQRFNVGITIRIVGAVGGE